MWRSPSPHKCIKNTCAHETTHTEHLLNTGRRPQKLPKGKPISSEWGRAKTKDKKRQRVWNRDLHTQEASHEGGKVSAHLDTPARVGTGELQTLKDNAALGARKAKQRIHQRCCQPALPSQAAYTHHGKRGKQVLRIRLQGSGPRERTGVDCYADTQGLVQHSWGSQEKAWASQRGKFVATKNS